MLAPLTAAEAQRIMRPGETGKIQKVIEAASPRSGTIPVWVHVIMGSTEAGKLLDTQIAAQISALNADFALAGFTFELVGVTHTTNASWFTMTPGSLAEEQAKTQLRVGGADVLNIYTTNLAQDGGLLGFTTYPWDYAAEPKMDGVMLYFETLPGGTATPYNLGKQAVHEVGHWLGLFHTFEGGACKGKGDYVADTPAEKEPAFGCPTGRDSCPREAGLDPVENPMNYSDDACLGGFTPGQNERMQKVYGAYRAP
jgi:hypothetical protein